MRRRKVAKIGSWLSKDGHHHHRGTVGLFSLLFHYLLLIFMPGKVTEGGPLFASAKLVVLGRPLIVGKVQIRRKLAKIPYHFTRTEDSGAFLWQAGPCFLLYCLSSHHTYTYHYNLHTTRDP